MSSDRDIGIVNAEPTPFAFVKMLFWNVVGMLYESGRWKKANYLKAVDAFRRAAVLGSPHGIANLARMILDGTGTKMDASRAFQLFLIAAEHDVPWAQNYLAGLFFDGVGTAKDERQAHEWYQRAANSDYVPAWFNLAWTFHEGIGCEVDYESAMHWYEKAASRGLAIAQYNLAILMVEHGQADKQRIDELLRRASEAGIVDAETARAVVQRELAKNRMKLVKSPEDAGVNT